LYPVESALCVIGTSRRISTATGGRVLLLEGWHEIEPWGCWSNAATARIGLSLAEPHSGRLGLELELVPPSAGTTLVVCVNDHALPEVIPATGINRWEVPDAVSAGQTQFVLSLTVSQTVCPAAVGTSADTRVLGIGLRAVTLQGLDPPTYHVGETVSLGDSSASDRVLRSGWHPAEPWGCWTSAADALLCVGFAEPLHGPMRLALSLLPSAIGPALTVTVNGVSLPAVVPTQGINEWLLPQRCTEDRSELSIGLHVSETFCPSANGLSADDRVLGIGVQSLMLSAAETSLCEVGETIRIASTSGGRGVLRTGWHRPEPWGCWSNQNEATLQLEFEAPLGGVFLLELDLLPPLFLQPVTVAVEDTPLLKRWVRDGINRWDIPRLCTEGQTTLTVRITVEHVARPADVQPSHDDRLLGVGIRSVRLAKSALAKSALA
jgi:hypothetical protein